MSQDVAKELIKELRRVLDRFDRNNSYCQEHLIELSGYDEMWTDAEMRDFSFTFNSHGASLHDPGSIIWIRWTKGDPAKRFINHKCRVCGRMEWIELKD